MRLAVIFHRLGPYHVARLEAAARVCELTAIELSAETGEYAWEKVSGARGFERVTLFPRGDSREATADEVRSRVRQALDAARPEAVAIPGWSDRAAFVALAWCAERGVPAILMSESTAHDEPRVAWKEWVKRRIVRHFSTALVGGRLHTAYLEQLGMHRDRVFTGYDVVENGHFGGKDYGTTGRRDHETVGLRESETTGLRDHKTAGLGAGHSVVGSEAPGPVVPLSCCPDVPTSPFFLASARFIEKKNLPFLLRAYARYREAAVKTEMGKAESRNSPVVSGPVVPWSLALLGDGPLKSDLCSLIADLSLQDSVLLPGFIQYDELPAWYARASAFVHASSTEQWGLVVNEAVAAGLPVIVSNRCGCGPELVREGVNGFTFDPANQDALAACLMEMASLPEEDRARFGAASREIASHHEPARFGEGLKQAAELAVKLPRRRARVWDRVMLDQLAKR